MVKSFFFISLAIISISLSGERTRHSCNEGLFNGIFFRYFVKLINEADLDLAIREKYHRYITNCATVMAEQGVNPETMLYGGNWHKSPASGEAVALTPQLSGCMLMEAMCILKPLP